MYCYEEKGYRLIEINTSLHPNKNHHINNAENKNNDNEKSKNNERNIVLNNGIHQSR